MSMISDAYKGKNDFDFTRTWRPVGIVAVVLIVISIGLLLTRGLNLSIDFEGGSIWEVPSQTLSVGDARNAVGNVGEKFQEATTSDGQRVVRVSGRVSTIEGSQQVAEKLAKAAGIDRTAVAVTTVGPSWGKDITHTARNSLIFFFIAMAAYIGWRLEPKMAASALLAVLHDIIVTLGIYSLFQFEVSPATMIAFLTILGFSLYDTIVVDDRIIDNTKRFGHTGRFTYTTLVRRSLNEVIMRSFNTTFVTLVPVATMLILGSMVYGEKTLGDFSLALLIGLALGSYSSIFLATPITVFFKEREQRWADIRQRLAAKGVDTEDSSWGQSHDQVANTAVSSVAGRSASGAAPALTTTIGGHPPRPRKKKR